MNKQSPSSAQKNNAEAPDTVDTEKKEIITLTRKDLNDLKMKIFESGLA